MYLVKIPNSQTQFWKTKRHKSEIKIRNKNAQNQQTQIEIKYRFNKNSTAPLYVYTCMYIPQSDELVSWVKTRAKENQNRFEDVFDRRERRERMRKLFEFLKEKKTVVMVKKTTNAFI